ncbi:helicase-like transcription factor CHR28 [Camellia sinensis]|nr:helicase-like transcription factor CHR28 [Camellia sinensis]
MLDNINSDFVEGSNDLIKVVGEKAIVFSQWTRMLDLLETCLKNSSIKYRRLDGTMSIVARDKAVKDFNTLPEVSVMIMSLKAASLGLNMVAACHVLLLDLWWNPTTEDQAVDRAHRIGQTRPVTVLRLTVKDTVEDRILALQQKKREMVASAFGEDETGSCQTRLTVEDLKYLFMV